MTMPDLGLLSRDCGDCPIRHRAICALCEPHELAELDHIKYYRSYEAGQTVVWADDTMEFVASVVTGLATISRALEDGRTQMVGLLFPSDFVGRPGREIAPFTVTAVTDLVMCCFRKRAFEQVLHETAHLSQRLLAMTLDELDAAREWMVVLGRKTAREKIASLIAIMAGRTAALAHASRGSVAFDLILSREAMADYLGLTIETVSRQMTALKQEGIIELQFKRQITVQNMALLLATAGDSPRDLQR